MSDDDTTALPVIIARLTTRMDAQERDSQHWRAETSHQLAELAAQISRLNETLHKSRETNWLPLLSVGIAAVLLIMAIGAAILSPLETRLRQNEHEISTANVENAKNHSEIQAEINAHHLLPIHPVAAKEVEYLRRDISELRQKVFGDCLHEPKPK